MERKDYQGNRDFRATIISQKYQICKPEAGTGNRKVNNGKQPGQVKKTKTIRIMESYTKKATMPRARENGLVNRPHLNKEKKNPKRQKERITIGVSIIMTGTLMAPNTPDITYYKRRST